ncbi:MAG: SPFH/Band 7/PHB domain protein [Actinomycetota bacterium]|nr:SPFH/Band 7/PHB domain protein [Actinomycetota bacterium]
MAAAIVAVVVVVVLLIALARTVRIVPQARAGVVERLGRYSKTLNPGLAILVPFMDRLKPLIDLREQVVSFPPQPVITEDNLVVQIDTVLYFTVTDPKSATYEIANPLQGIEQITVTTLRNVVGGMTLETALTSRDHVNATLRGVLDDATGKWGIRINRVEIKSIDPPGSIQEAMEKQMRADRDKRAAILTAEGVKASQILTAEGQKQAAVLTAEGAKQAAILRAEGDAKAIDTVFAAIHHGKPDQELLSYQYLQMLPQLAQGSANKVFVIPSEFTDAFSGIGKALGGRSATAGAEGAEDGPGLDGPRARGELGPGDGPSGAAPSGDDGPGPRGDSEPK